MEWREEEVSKTGTLTARTQGQEEAHYSWDQEEAHYNWDQQCID